MQWCGMKRRARGNSKLVPTVAGLLLVVLAAAAPAEEIAGRVLTHDGLPLKDAVVFVRELPAGSRPQDQAKTAVMDQVDKEFVPHVLPISVGTQVEFPNHDQIHHHVYSFSRTKMFEIPLYKGEKTPPILFDKEGAVKIGCNIHDWMSAVILVLPTPLFSKTGDDGSFRLGNLAPGRYSLAAWHERSNVSVEETVREVATDTTAPVTFTLDVSPARSRPGEHGLRTYE